MSETTLRRLTKVERETVRAMFDGHCAYCGLELGARWHADHIEPVLRNSFFNNRGPARPQNHRLENMFPACATCNISKGQMTLEVWRGWLSGHVASLNKYNTPYRLAKAYGLIRETGAEVVFYFERVRGETQAKSAA
jgi:hypothetical protein